MRTIAIAGHLCADVTPQLRGAAQIVPGRLFDVGPLGFAVGGCVANTARTLAALGHPVTAYGCVGDDELGAVVTAGLTSELVTTRVRTVAAATSYSLVIEPPDTDRTFWHHTGANDLFDGTEVDLDDVELLHVGYPPLLPGTLPGDGAPLVALLRRAKTAGATTSLDLAVVDRDSPVGRLDWTAILAGAAAESDLLSPSVDDLTSALGIDQPYDQALAVRLADQLLTWGAAVVVLSAGAHGLLLRSGGLDRLRRAGAALAPLAEAWADRTLWRPAIVVEHPLTTNGAGDASTAGLLYAVSTGLGPDAALELATRCSAAAIAGQPPTLS